ncbi:PEP-CTERM sorting domain-containing protein [Roseiconus lacunae]|uniref:PEP-CTERM sorting domain-containing protein n=1 Tax=Roseiconus lacunae TaxID=2605694 RepID=A0ABT7PRG4_9BACT|nr:PEP-CTERM sorting domain-containing protein [Roseiconus lacunae]MDM4019040.1 PEP-CTERM sorting domain-containing protein [Roseiconus lacunae]
MKRFLMAFAVTYVLIAFSSPAINAETVSLASSMNPAGYLAENQVTGSYWRINNGDGTLGTATSTGDRDGPGNYAERENPSDTGTGFGDPMDMFPREANFLIGSFSFDETGLTGVGTETRVITNLNPSEFWKNDPNRTNPSLGPSVLSDISDHAFGLAFFDGDGEIKFGGIDATDTVTFTDGVLTSVDFNVTTTLSFSAFTETVTYDGIFSATGDSISYQIDDTEPIAILGGLPSTFQANLSGTINQVGSYSISAVPEPNSLVMLVVGTAAVAFRRRRRGDAIPKDP